MVLGTLSTPLPSFPNQEPNNPQHIRTPRTHSLLHNHHVRNGHPNNGHNALLFLAFARPSVLHIRDSDHSIRIGI